MFGKTQRGVSERPNKPKKPLIPAWLGTLVIILIVLSFAVALLLWKPWEPVKPKDQITSQQNKEETNKDYRFYDLLPQQQVTPIPEQAVPETKDKSPVVIIEAPANNQPASEATGLSAQPVAPKANYILQVRSYSDPDAADARRAEIILNGLSADVMKTTEGGQVWYRVISGPYDSQEAALIAQQTLQHSGIDSIVVKR
ncbi:SPOR domain-containing protein [Acinetobacter portensis]|uniref:SPOR domain-containing protein n=2 Tax=Acinetobacter TaxID=469 RepID=A0A6L6GGK1_9GAMM|nr:MULTISPECIES: SPOR domain-containing protein [Acinetobacter]MCK7609352.1 SPOR domain-containing protein [Acinetobacter portensis]MCK7640157.1 SPOR domain-containing protein [Acinetobacter portensis]MDY6457381.1 SPOR domain-containing protein [Acinetobacter faecalis]MDY6459605.1 SPOR domain-containing protein [Acinetobacter faecalis]MDY6462426.1 SPOR domain-containing protein [Acinetobacter faecalis]